MDNAYPDFFVDFTHSEIISARVGTKNISRPGWIGILKEVHSQMLSFLITNSVDRKAAIEQLIFQSPSNLDTGEITKDGWSFEPRIGCSIQRMDAQASWRHCKKLATQNHPKIELEVKVKWKVKPGAQFPGQTKILRPNGISDLDLD
jgi:hypothetical protein